MVCIPCQNLDDGRGDVKRELKSYDVIYEQPLFISHLSNIVPISPMAEVESEDEDSVFDEDRLERRESNPGEEVEEKGISFQPPLYIQRYDKALDILLEERWVHAINRVVSSLTSNLLV